MSHYLSIILFTPLAGALLLLFVSKQNENAIRWMRKQPWLGDRFLAAWGPSRGGELALLLGATFPDINAVSAWVPSGVMFWGIGPNESGDPRDRAYRKRGAAKRPDLRGGGRARHAHDRARSDQRAEDRRNVSVRAGSS